MLAYAGAPYESNGVRRSVTYFYENVIRELCLRSRLQEASYLSAVSLLGEARYALEDVR